MSEIDAAAAVLGDRAVRDAPIGPLTTYRVGGPAALLVEDASEEDLDRLRLAVAESGLPVLVVGNGSNLLVADAGFPGIALTLGERFRGIAVDEAVVTAGGAVSLPVLARRTAAAGLTGFEWAVGVPGTAGGAVRMNAGGHGSDMSACVSRVGLFSLGSGRSGVFDVSDLALGYRASNVAPDEIVVSVELVLVPGDRSEAEARISEIVRWRREHQPGGQNAGSIFTNPPGDSAGRLVDACGLKGFRVGSAHVSTKHANFFQADDGGSADDVVKLIEEVRRRVREQTGIDLHPEVKTVGFDR